MSGSCEICNVKAELKCNGCKSVFYCGFLCQKKHWKSHKIDCMPFEEAKTPELNRFLRATRDIPAGTTVFVEAPLIFGPKWNTNEEEQNIPILPCVGCFSPVRIGLAKCDKCFWPACSTSCPGLKDPLIHGIECPILSFGNLPESFSNNKEALDYYRSDAILTLKCLALQRRYPKKWERLMAMESHDEERKGTEFYEEADKRVVSYLLKNYLEIIKMIELKTSKEIFPHASREILHKICGIIEVNFMMIDLPNGQEISGVFSNGCLMEHSCVPNCIYTFDVDKGFRINVKAGRDIKKGEHLKIMYTHILWGTNMRRDHLKATKYFSCTCERCSDPTELNTYISALKCIGTAELTTCGGYQLPINPLSDSTDWACNKCPVRISCEHHDFLLSQISAEVDSITIDKQGNVRELEKLIDKLSQLLHNNHYHLFALKHSLIQLYGHQAGYLPEQLSDILLEKKITMCKDMLVIVEILDPNSMRLALYTGIILYELHLAIVQLYQRKMKILENLEKENILLNFIEAKKYLEKSKKILKIESDSPAGFKLNENVEKSIENLRQIFIENDFVFE